MKRPTNSLSIYQVGCVCVLLTTVSAIAIAQTNDTVKQSSKRATNSEASKTSHHEKMSNPAGKPATPIAPTGTGAGANAPFAQPDSAMSAPPGWVPPAHNAQQAPHGNQNGAATKPHAKKDSQVRGTVPKK
jgi:hypothetical protein